jgi:hypothetical protein
MSNRRRPRNPKPPLTDQTAVDDVRPVAKVSSPADVLAMVPYLFGFEPHESVVVVSLKGPRRRFGPIVRADLVEPDQAAALVGYLADVVEAHGFGAVLIAAYSTRKAAADEVVPALAEELASAGVIVYEALRADGERWWSYTCDSRCCPPEGTRYDPATTSVAALAVSMGMAKLPTRGALAKQFAPVAGGADRQRANEIAREAVAASAGGVGRSARIADVIASALGRDAVDSVTLGTLLGAVQDLRNRDLAWMLISRDDADAHFELWRQIMTAADDDLLAPAGSLCAFAAWLAGRGALAATAADRVAEVAADYPMLGLVRDALESCMSPDVWQEYLDSLSRVSADWPIGGAAAGDAAV